MYPINNIGVSGVQVAAREGSLSDFSGFDVGIERDYVSPIEVANDKLVVN